MPDIDSTAAECRVFTRYLIGHLPDAYISRKYAQAFEPGYPLAGAAASGFDALLLKLAVLHPLLTRTADIYSRFFRPASAVRKRLVLLLALLESWAATAGMLDSTRRTGFVRFVIVLLADAGLSAVLLIVAAPFLLPAQLLSGARSGSGREAS
jgi:hypothetical protein